MRLVERCQVKNSILSSKRGNVKLWAILFWLLIWQVLSMHIGREILLPSPFSVFNRLMELVTESNFWASILFSSVRIMSGFFLATLTGILFASLAARFKLIEQLLVPVIMFANSTPVASIIILLLIWFSSSNLAMVVSFLMVMPIMYTNILSGIKSTDLKLLEMAQVFSMSTKRKIFHIYIWQVLPFFKAAALIGLGISWKSGIAAEIIGIPRGSIGASLHQARIFIATPDLFAWTVTIIFMSMLFERLFMLLLTQLAKRLERM